MNDLINKIKALKAQKNAVILAHCYQPVEVDLVADYVGDSLYLSQVAAKTDADIIVFAGVYFMAQTAKLLSPNKKVLLPQIEAGCRMADMINYEQLKKFKETNPDIPTVCYINSTAEVKSECDICCTSSNAVKIVNSLNAEKILFLPDTYLGKWVEKQLGKTEVITYPGFCPTHLHIRPDDIEKARQQHPDALVLAHPECHTSVSDIADYVGSTTGIMKFAKESNNKSFIIATEEGVVDRLKRDFPDKEFIPVKENIICPNMKMTSLEDILEVLEKENNEIFVDEKIAPKAVKCIDRMLEVSK
ncbi:quinolinate synthase NadA [bacterium]|nr:quinolinate synthase NadA [bacterium]